MQEIRNDVFWEKLREVVLIFRPREVLEIGGGTGEGSTTAFLGLTARVLSIEADPVRCRQLARVIACAICATSTGRMGLLPLEKVREFYNRQKTKLNDHAWDTVKQWHVEAFNLFENVPNNGITLAMELCGTRPDMILLDGSPFTAKQSCQRSSILESLRWMM